MNDLSVGKRLALSFGLVLCAMLAAGGTGLYGVMSVQRVLTFVTGPAWATADGAMGSTIGVQSEMLAITHLVRDGDEPAVWSNFKNAHASGNQALARLIDSPLIPEDDLAALQDKLTAYRMARAQMLSALSPSTQGSATGDPVATQRDFERAGAALVAHLGRIAANGDGQIAGRTNTALAFAARCGVVICIAFVGGIVLWLGATLLTRVAIARPLSEMATYFRHLGGGIGDLTVNLRAQRGDEIGQVVHGFNGFVTTLRSLMHGVADTSTRLAGATIQVAAASAQSGEIIRERHAETEAAATALTELAGSAQRITQSTCAVADAARGSQQQVEEGHRAVTQVRAAAGELVGEIRTSAEAVAGLQRCSSELSAMLGAIREIAEQTNLLALNAAIEAARAGEQGRGFAIVADEVRVLAHRAGDSTTTIDAMVETLRNTIEQLASTLDTSRERAKQTATAAADAGAALAGIDDAMTRVRDMNTEVAAGARAHSQALDGVRRNLLRLRQGAEQTANAANEMGTAAAQLEQIAAQLQAGVGRFKLA